MHQEHIGHYLTPIYYSMHAKTIDLVTALALESPYGIHDHRMCIDHVMRSKNIRIPNAYNQCFQSFLGNLVYRYVPHIVAQYHFSPDVANVCHRKAISYIHKINMYILVMISLTSSHIYLLHLP